VVEMEGRRVGVVRVELVPEASGSPAEGGDEH
jgi:hypothetical protein